jgi:hypothetical protein
MTFKQATVIGAAGAAVLALAGLAAPAHAVAYLPIPGTGYDAFASGIAGVGNSGVDAFGNPWNWGITEGGVTPGVAEGLAAWGTPGLGDGEVPYGSATPAVDFEITFLLPIGSSASISRIPSPGEGGYNETTRFDAGDVEWTPVFVGPNQVDFFAPTGTELVAGEEFFVNVVFNQRGLSGSDSGFSAVFSGAAPVPEISTWAMMLVGVAGLGATLRRRRVAVAAA